MNRQGKNGIEWADYTLNLLPGCHYGCQWDMPDGSTAICYAKATAEGVAAPAYPDGFAHAYWKPERLYEPLKVKKPARIFLNSMGDMFGHWVRDEQIHVVLNMCRQASWHTFLVLTKNPKRLPKFSYPPNVHVGMSVPPTRKAKDNGTVVTMTDQQRHTWLAKGLEALSRVEATVRWLSAEPLAWDVAPLVEGADLEWLVVGAASNGDTYYQPDPAWVSGLLAVADHQAIPVFFKGNLVWPDWREEYPNVKPLSLF